MLVSLAAICCCLIFVERVISIGLHWWESCSLACWTASVKDNLGPYIMKLLHWIMVSTHCHKHEWPSLTHMHAHSHPRLHPQPHWKLHTYPSVGELDLEDSVEAGVLSSAATREDMRLYTSRSLSPNTCASSCSWTLVVCSICGKAE